MRHQPQLHQGLGQVCHSRGLCPVRHRPGARRGAHRRDGPSVLAAGGPPPRTDVCTLPRQDQQGVRELNVQFVAVNFMFLSAPPAPGLEPETCQYFAGIKDTVFFHQCVFYDLILKSEAQTKAIR